MTAGFLEIIHQEKEFIVINKPSGLLAVPGRGPDKMDSISQRVKKNFPASIEQPAVHRLDMDTSGVMVLAFTKEAHRGLSLQFEQRLIGKRYIALLDGIIPGSQGRIELAFRLDPANRPYQVYDPVHGKMGITLWKKIAKEPPFTRIEFTPLTGRTHQLRLHASHELGLGVPIADDPLYGNGKSPGKMKLHASYLSFFHPLTGAASSFSSTPPF